jgi:hypothetical protein
MNKNDRWIVITSINRPTRAIEVVSSLCRSRGWRAVVVGDTKTPADWNSPGIDFLSADRQRELFGQLAELIPYRHYCRKNLGYLYAIRHGAELILDTDDDNIPYPNFGTAISPIVRGRLLSGPGWVNIYKHYIDGGAIQIWPRGLPLDAIDQAGTVGGSEIEEHCPIQQYLADNDPDVDAIYRLTTRGAVFFKKDAPSLIVERNAWVPFNSQNTAFFRQAFALLYLPCFVSFRMTDIWRSFVAQAALWSVGRRLAFHGATVEQVRNEHDLMKDFEDEVVGYLGNRRIGQILEEALRIADATTSETPVFSAIAMHLWRALHAAAIIPAQEMPVLEAWVSWLNDLLLLSSPAGRT